eukprot:TRINITY_DN2178_c1_g1_i1.p1 TRINITY_DN2178_c1_g1~~TRINITY_DN2178_c1_g1_i1.p1  ORF type:complete len:250 (-),score=99.71 TRINITY_DN2178_c1_g1_i1:129-878(-)
MNDRIKFVVINEQNGDKRSFSISLRDINEQKLKLFSAIPAPYIAFPFNDSQPNLIPQTFLTINPLSTEFNTTTTYRLMTVPQQQLPINQNEQIWFKIAEKNELPNLLKQNDSNIIANSPRKRIVVNGRDVVLFYVNNNYFATDALCYHAGGPLNGGDIEELGSLNASNIKQYCVRCPWHGYIISIETGESAVRSRTTGEITPLGIHQRCHKVEEREDGIYVNIIPANQLKDNRDSDNYALLCLGINQNL